MNATTALNAATKFISANYPTIPGKISFGICAAPVTEMALRTVIGLGQLLTGNGKDKTSEYLSKDLAGTLLYGLCAARVFPGSSYLGVAGFAIYSVFARMDKDAYYTAWAVNEGLGYANEYIMHPLYDHVLHPVFNGIEWVLNKISLPKNRTWYAVGAVGLAGACWHVYSTRIPK